MGEFLSEPIKTKETESGESTRLKYASSGMQGWRKNMEDAHINLKDIGDDVSLFGVFDGHGGPEVARYAKAHLPKLISSSASFKSKNYKQALIDAFLEIDKSLETEIGKKEIITIRSASPTKESPIMGYQDPTELANFIGCTACVALITHTEIYVANAGDSRCVLSKGGKAFDLSVDHKPELEVERARITKAGGYIEENRVNGSLNLSRCLGDLDYKHNPGLKPEEQMITSFPDVKVEKIGADFDFLIIGCDGIWDCLTSQEAVNYVKDGLAKSPSKGSKPAEIAKIIENMMDSIIVPNIDAKGGLGCDNMTCEVIQFLKTK